MSDDQAHPHGRPVTVMKFSETGEIIVDFEEVEKIFNHEEIEDRKIVILSLIGAFRGGKSYFLNYCLRFLYAHYSSVNDPKITDGEFLFEKDQNWMGTSNEPLKGFSWRSGVKRDTIGIIIWSDVFLHTIDKTGEKIAIVVMDTQGLFDKHSTLTDNSRIFALNNLISSIQVLNLANRIQEDQLQYLQLTTEYALFSSTNKIELDGKSFQNLLFLIRDWNNSGDYKYGTTGGFAYLYEIMKIKPNQKPELQSVRKTINSCFDDIACCLLPNPGKGVSRGQGYNGSWSGMDDEFKEELQRLIECLLIPDNLIIKKINSTDVSVKEMKHYIQEYLKLFQSNQLPQVSSIYESTVMRFMNNMVDKCFEDYKLTICRNEDIITEENISVVHEKCKEKSLELYDSVKKMGNAGHAAVFKANLKKEIDDFFIIFKDQTEEHLEKLKENRAKYQTTEKNNSKRKEEITRSIEHIKSQLEELSQKRQENQFLTEFYNNQEEVLKIRLAHDEEELKIIEDKIRKADRFRLLLITLVAGVTIPLSTVSVAGAVAAGASEISTLSTIGVALDALNIVSSTFSFIQGTRSFFFGRNNQQ